MNTGASKSLISATRIRTVAIAICTLALPALAHSGPSVDEIVNKAYCTAFYQGADGQGQVHMDIVDGKGSKRQRDLTIIRRDAPAPGKDEASIKKDNYCGSQRYYAYFHRPSDVSKMSFLVWKHENKSDDRWLYLPALDLVKRIAAADKRTSFFGSHFYYEDISGRKLSEDTHELIDTTKNYYVLKSTPKDPKSVEFSYYKVWVHRKTFLPTKSEYYDARGKKYRVYEVKKVENIQGYPTAMKIRMSDERIGGYTDVTFKKATYNIDLPKDIFTERYLRKAPMQHLK